MGPGQAGPLRAPVTLLEVADAQNVEAEVYHWHIAPLAEESGATVVLYGTPWNGSNWFERAKQGNRELTTADGLPRHFRVPWQEVARYSPLYGQYVAQQRARLGQDHPLFQAGYELQPVPVVSRLLSETRRRKIQGVTREGGPPSPA